MISNFKPCCRRCLTPNENFYLEIRNETQEYLHAMLFYSLHGKEIAKPTKPFGPGKVERIVFPYDALGIFFQVFRTEFVPPASVCTKFIPSRMISRYRVRKLEENVYVCTEV